MREPGMCNAEQGGINVLCEANVRHKTQSLVIHGTSRYQSYHRSLGIIAYMKIQINTNAADRKGGVAKLRRCVSLYLRN